MNNKDIAKEIKKAIIDLGVSNEEFAKMCGINPSVFSNILNKKRKFSYRHMVKIIEYIPTLKIKDFEDSNNSF